MYYQINCALIYRMKAASSNKIAGKIFDIKSGKYLGLSCSTYCITVMKHPQWQLSWTVLWCRPIRERYLEQSTNQRPVNGKIVQTFSSGATASVWYCLRSQGALLGNWSKGIFFETKPTISYRFNQKAYKKRENETASEILSDKAAAKTQLKMRMFILIVYDIP